MSEHRCATVSLRLMSNKTVKTGLGEGRCWVTGCRCLSWSQSRSLRNDAKKGGKILKRKNGDYDVTTDPEIFAFSYKYVS
jgi:hypothetical protein